MVSQNVLFGEALGVEDYKKFRDRMPLGAYREIKSQDASPATNIKEVNAILPKTIGEKHVGVLGSETPSVVVGINCQQQGRDHCQQLLK